ncbi:hypothetical protein [Streptomyces carpinensis]|uniref:Secreted protein n=1 Tax=Streptomyces carpinensis TaxID=66369 RepID=A0ABV1WF15_9ACTN|nr:hypothetical protein [Streptomyces carpinensis]
MVIVVAVLVLPVLGVLLLVMDRVEDWLTAASSGPRHARVRRHLRLIPGGAHHSQGRSADEPSERGTRAA